MELWSWFQRRLRSRENERFAGDLGQLVAGQIMQSPAGKLLKGKHWQLPPTVSTVIQNRSSER